MSYFLSSDSITNLEYFIASIKTNEDILKKDFYAEVTKGSSMQVGDGKKRCSSGYK